MIGQTASGGTVIAVREQTRVDGPPADAFRLFTAGINEWWPLEEGYSFGGDRAKEVHLEATPGGRFYERYVDGEEFDVGRVLVCVPPHLIVFSWKHPEWSAATEVEVSFVAEGDQTCVTVEHRGFELLGPGGEASAKQYGGGWPRVIERFASRARRPPI